MTHASTIWLDWLFTRARPKAHARLHETAPVSIEVERLPDYLWRGLGFRQPTRPDELSRD